MKYGRLTTGYNLPALTVENLGKRYREKPALGQVNFTVPDASLTVILGSAGAGKTTTLRLVAGLERPDSGRILIYGRDVGTWEPRRRNIAMIFDNLALYPDKTGFDNIASPLLIRGDSKSATQKKVNEIGEMLKISHILDRLPKTMSGGERQRIALGRALVREPNIFLLDEPLSSLDAQLRVELRAELRRLQRELEYPFLMATPDFTEALAIADTIIMLREGRVVQIAAPQELYDKPVNREVASFVGAPQINLIEARFETRGNDGVIRAADTLLPVPEHFQGIFSSGTQSFELGIRPENIVLADPARASIQATIVDLESLGTKSVLTVRNQTAELKLLVKSTETPGISMGQRVGLECTNTAMQLAFDRETGQRISP